MANIQYHKYYPKHSHKIFDRTHHFSMKCVTVFDFFKTGTAEFLFSSNFIYSYYFYSVCSFDVKARFPEYA